MFKLFVIYHMSFQLTLRDIFNRLILCLRQHIQNIVISVLKTSDPV